MLLCLRVSRRWVPNSALAAAFLIRVEDLVEDLYAYTHPSPVAFLHYVLLYPDILSPSQGLLPRTEVQITLTVE